MATKIQLLTGWICSTTDFYFWGKGERQIKEKLKQIGAQMFPTELEADRYFRFSDR